MKWPREAEPFLTAIKSEDRLLVILTHSKRFCLTELNCQRDVVNALGFVHGSEKQASVVPPEPEVGL